MSDIGLYLHFPFCVRKCAYCDFLSFPATEEVKRIYAAALIREIRGYARAAKGHTVSTVFLGGGTPSIMPARQMKAIFQALYDSFEILPGAEITMEMNPGTVNESNLTFVFDHVNRVSLGAQSGNDAELLALGRIHTRRDVERSVQLLKDSGVKNLNLDLMLGIPGQTAEEWRSTLRWAIDLKPEHISAYSLQVEDGTEFRRLQKAGKLHLPDEDTEREMAALTVEMLEGSGYRQYEFSNYAKEGFLCRHNVRYWKRGDYLGLGLGASSLFEGSRWHNTRNLEHYFEHSSDPGQIVREMEQLDRRTEIEEAMFLGLRMSEGIEDAEFEARYGLSVFSLYGEIIERQIAEGVLLREGNRIFLSPRGIEVSNVVLADYLLD